MSDKRLLTKEGLDLGRILEGSKYEQALLNHLAAQQDEIGRLREALAWYADKGNYVIHWRNDATSRMEAHEDNGARARAALDTEGAGE